MPLISLLLACGAVGESTGSFTSPATPSSSPPVVDTATTSGGATSGGNNGGLPAPDGGLWRSLSIEMDGTTLTMEREATSPTVLDATLHLDPVGHGEAVPECAAGLFLDVHWLLASGVEGAIDAPIGVDVMAFPAGPELPIDPAYPMPPSFWHRAGPEGEVVFLSGGMWTMVDRDDVAGTILTVEGAQRCVGADLDAAWTLDPSTCTEAGTVRVVMEGYFGLTGHEATHLGMLDAEGERLCVYAPDLVPPPAVTADTGTP